ncbi:peroxisomal targeting signal 1 receptor-like isoform X2 [Dysidea avara]|uniref:peroxisomal targeting signal 1 receptor-like isoform X2 n=1 Tax=Dysidea avara TaxID=196820 RepID=UPI00332EC3C4
MALKDLVEGECGTTNPLMQWTSHFAQDKALHEGGLQRDRLRELAQTGQFQEAEKQLVEEFLHGPTAPQTFHMAGLLHQVQHIENQSAQTRQHADDWVQEYSISDQPMTGTTTEEKWAAEYVSEVDRKTAQWTDEFHGNRKPEHEKWADEFVQERLTQQAAGDVQQVAKKMADELTDPDIAATEFMQFVKKLSSGEATIEDNQVIEKSEGQVVDNWTEEFQQEEHEIKDQKFWEQLEKQWLDLSRQTTEHEWLSDYEHDWLTDYEKFTEEYHFEQNNPLRNITHPFEEGLKKLKEGDLSSAVLLFEAEVQERPENVEGWKYLGTTQADNEQELLAIAALNKCLQLDPGNLTALMALAVSYTNESRQQEAVDTLKTWISSNPKYNTTCVTTSSGADIKKSFTHSFMSNKMHAEARDMYIAAACQSPNNIDADVQVGLGVLFNLSGDYEKAVDCFNSALQVRPNAVHAYRQALNFLPGFTRSRYNLGISCINLKAYREAVEHFLTALDQQRKGKGPNGHGKMSDNIWSTLRLAVTLLGNHDITKFVDAKDLDPLLRQFGI